MGCSTSTNVVPRGPRSVSVERDQQEVIHVSEVQPDVQAIMQRGDDDLLNNVNVVAAIDHLEEIYLIPRERAIQAARAALEHSNDSTINYDNAVLYSLDWLFSHAEQSRQISEASVASVSIPSSASVNAVADPIRPFSSDGIVSVDELTASVAAEGRLETTENSYVSEHTHSAAPADEHLSSPQPVKAGSASRHSSYDLCCPICFEYYNDRVATPCRHFFCRACIVDYMRTTPGETSSCLCPMCRLEVKIEQLLQVPYLSTLSDALNRK